MVVVIIVCIRAAPACTLGSDRQRLEGVDRGSGSSSSSLSSDDDDVKCRDITWVPCSSRRAVLYVCASGSMVELKGLTKDSVTVVWFVWS